MKIHDEWPFDDPDNEPEYGLDCDYGLTEFCVDQFARDTGCTVNCGLYMEISRGYDRPNTNYKFWKVLGMIFMILIAAWTVPAMSKKMGLNSPLNMGIGICGFGLMILLSYLESKGEI